MRDSRGRIYDQKLRDSPHQRAKSEPTGEEKL